MNEPRCPRPNVTHGSVAMSPLNLSIHVDGHREIYKQPCIIRKMSFTIGHCGGWFIYNASRCVRETLDANYQNSTRREESLHAPTINNMVHAIFYCLPPIFFLSLIIALCPLSSQNIITCKLRFLSHTNPTIHFNPPSFFLFIFFYGIIHH